MLKAVSPFPVQFKLIKDGKLIDQKEDVYQYEFDPKNEKGNYRLVTSLKLNKEWTTWVMTQPIYVF